MFKAAQSANLADRRSCIVSRRGTSLNPLSRKLAEDIWTLANCLASNLPVKWIMYRNGKQKSELSSLPDTEALPDPTTILLSVSANGVCNKEYDKNGDTMSTNVNHSINNGPQSDIVNTSITQRFPIVVNAQLSPNQNNGVHNKEYYTNGDTMSTQKTNVTNINHIINNGLQCDTENTTLTQGCPIVVNAQCSPNQSNSFVVNQLDSLRTTITEVKSDLNMLKNRLPARNVIDHCHLYVSVKMKLQLSFAKSHLEQFLHCEILQVHPLYVDTKSSYKVKIFKVDLWYALNSQDSALLRVRLGKKSKYLSSVHSNTSPQANLPPTNHNSTHMCIASWNCRGLGSSEPYLKILSSSSDIILLQEHWLWPFELHKLSSIIPEYSTSGKADNKLTEEYNYTRGCGVLAFYGRNLLTSPL